MPSRTPPSRLGTRNNGVRASQSLRYGLGCDMIIDSRHAKEKTFLAIYTLVCSECLGGKTDPYFCLKYRDHIGHPAKKGIPLCQWDYS